MDIQLEESKADRKEMKNFMQQILMIMNSHMGQPSTSNFGFTNNSVVTLITGQTSVVIPATQQGQHPDPPPHGSGKI